MSTSDAASPDIPDRIPTEDRVRQAAVRLFARRGYGATGIRDIAREAGMTSATLYHYTSSKEDLLVRIMIDGQSALNEAAERELAGIDDPVDRLGILVGTLVAAHATNPLSTRVIDTEIRSLAPDSAGRANVIGLRDLYEGHWSAALQDGARDDRMDVADHHLTRLALLTMCTGMSNWYRPDETDDLEHLAARFVDLALGAVRARRGERLLSSADVPRVRRDRFTRMRSEPALPVDW